MTKFESVNLRIDELKNDYGTMSIKELEQKYHASYSTIQRVLKYNGHIRPKKENIKYIYLNDNLENFKEDWINGILSINELEQKYHCKEATLKAKARDFNIKRKLVKDKIDTELLIKDWNSKDYLSYQLCDKYNICESTLLNILKNNGIKVGDRNGRKYYFNEKYFDIINDEHKAYWLGFIYADGSHNCKRYSLNICLKKEDDYILKEFYKDINCNREIAYVTNKQYNREYAYAYVQHPHMSKTLIEKGVPPDKSFKITFPSDDIVPQIYKKDFIRGYFDGDGGISIPNNFSKVSIKFVGNYNFINQLNQYLIDNVPCYLGSSFYKVKNSDIYVISKGGRYKVESFLNWLYKDSSIHLMRKYNKYIQLLEYNKSKG